MHRLDLPELPTDDMANTYVVNFINPTNGRVDQEDILKLEAPTWWPAT